MARPGPELDAEVARAVCNNILVVDTQSGQYRIAGSGLSKPVPQYSTDSHAAAALVEHMRGLGWALRTKKGGHQMAASFVRSDTSSTYRYFFADTLPTAICHAAIAVRNGTIVQSR